MNCKPGDLALIIRTAHPAGAPLVGCMCEVLRRAIDGESFPDARHIRVCAQGKVMWLVRLTHSVARRGDKGTPFASAYAAGRDDNLLPIRPEPDPLEQKHSTPRKERA